jgi:acyl CoA:acetate/3-ketoacid CoA transferase beta subunit/acyl CoA:acetate/3-ketoacid CoA transferase alpha subunit
MRDTTLIEAVRTHVTRGMHLNFASTPSRSNAAIVEIARQFRGTHPHFTLSATGFHSTAHLLGLLRLGSRYISCFYGDNYPTPRPNPLYQELLSEGAVLEHWSLLSYVAALRAAAFGQAGAVIRSLEGTSLGAGLISSRRYIELEAAFEATTDPVTEATTKAAAETQPRRSASFGLLAPLTPDISFLHAAVGDARGFAWFSPPYSEGFHGAMAARRGVILTVDDLRQDDTVRARPELIAIPPHRVLAICEAPFGAHPQPVHFAPSTGENLSYADDFAHYQLWSDMTGNRARFKEFEQTVLGATDAWAAYRDFVGVENLDRLRRPPRAGPLRASNVAVRTTDEVLSATQLSNGERTVILAARTLADQIRTGQHRAVLAGIGLSFAAARLCKLLLGDSGKDVELMVETGFTGFGEPSQGALDSYLLSQSNIEASQRLTSIESVLGTLACGGQNACLGVIGCAQVDARGNVNSTFVAGQLVVGSGGACDIACGAREVTVLARTDRLVTELEYVTSPGHAVTRIVTERGVLVRKDDRWILTQQKLDATKDDSTLDRWPWPNVEVAAAPKAPPPSAVEAGFIRDLRAEHHRTEAALVPHRRAG